VKVTPDPNTPVFSSYTGQSLGGFHSIRKGTICDAKPGERNYGKPYHGGISMKHSSGREYVMLHFR
jgi:hypothetical protein